VPALLEDFEGLAVGNLSPSLTRGLLATAFGKPLTLGIDESMQDLANRLEEPSYDLRRVAEQALTAHPAELGSESSTWPLMRPAGRVR
jgi:hypothetical protein